MLAFSIDYYGIFFGATQSVELFCTYGKSSALTRLLTLHMFRDLSDFIITKSFFHEQEEMLWKTVKMLDGVS